MCQHPHETQLFATCNQDNVVMVWRLRRRKEKKVESATLTLHLKLLKHRSIGFEILGRIEFRRARFHTLLTECAAELSEFPLRKQYSQNSVLPVSKNITCRYGPDPILPGLFQSIFFQVGAKGFGLQLPFRWF